MQVHHKMRDSKSERKNTSLHDHQICMQMEMQTSLYDNNARKEILQHDNSIKCGYPNEKERAPYIMKCGGGRLLTTNMG